MPCEDNAVCQDLVASARCVADVDRPEAPDCSEPPLAAFCDVPCASDEDCGVLSSSHRCISGYCRVVAPGTGAAGAGGASGAGGAAGGGGIAGAGACPSGEVNGNEVLVLGDRFIALTHQITACVEDLARQAGALPAGQRYRDYSSNTETGFITDESLLAVQYATGQAEGPVKVVIMDGGGSDMFMGSCLAAAPAAAAGAAHGGREAAAARF